MLYLEEHVDDLTGNKMDILRNHGGAAVYISDANNPHYIIKEDDSFATIIVLGISSVLYIDIFPPFIFYAAGPKAVEGSSHSLYDSAY